MVLPLEPFPWPAFVLFEALHMATCYPTNNTFYGKALFAPGMIAVAVYLYTNHFGSLPGSTGYMIGTSLLFHSWCTIHIVYIQKGFPDFWRRNRDGKENPSSFSLIRKLGWMVEMAYGSRKVGWVQEPRGALPPKPQFASRWAFIASSLFWVAAHALTIQGIERYWIGHVAFDASLHPSTGGPVAYIASQPLLQRIPDLASWGVGLMSTLTIPNIVMGILAVGSGLYDPEDCPSFYGLVTEAHSVRKFWGKYWHQGMRPMLSGMGKFVAYEVLHLKSGTNLSSYTQLFVGFLISGTIHSAGDYLNVGYLPTFALKFFLLQAVVIVLEDFFLWCTKYVRVHLPWWINRAFGYCWVVVWMCWSGPIWLDPMNEMGYKGAL